MRKKIIYLMAIISLVAVGFLMDGCQNKQDTKKKAQQTIIIAKPQASVTQLYYKGTLAPLRTIPVLSPVDGTVTAVSFKYGSFVTENQELVLIDSPKLADDYRQAVTKYLQAKDTYENALQSMQGTEALHKAGVIATDEYLTSKSQYETDTLNYYSAIFELEKVLKKAEIDPTTIERLSIVDTQAVNQILQRRFSHIVVRSPGQGVALFPVKNGGDDSKNGKNGKLALGTSVKEGQLILSVGDLSGFSATLQVSEININKMKTQLPVTVTGDAFPGITLQGMVTAVANQANPGGNGGGGGGLSLFNITVEVPNITKAQQQIIHVGMSANFAIEIKNPPQILLPIKAVFQQNGQNMVTVIDPKTGATKNVPVVMGDTTLTDVTIVDGLQSGQAVVVHD